MKKSVLMIPLIVVVLFAGFCGLIVGVRSTSAKVNAISLREAIATAASNYTQEARLATGVSDGFASGVAVSGDTAAIFSGVGVYVYVRSGTAWSQQAVLVPSDGASVQSGVGLDGDTIVIGGSKATVNSNANQGAAYVFLRSGTTWTQQQRLTASDGAAGNEFGNSVAIRGGTIVVGAWMASISGSANQGATYAFVRNGSSWTEETKLVANDGGANHFFGKLVAISGDSVVVTRATRPTLAPMVYVFLRSGSTWSQQQQMSVCEPSGNGGTQCNFGSSVSIDGDTMAVGNSFLNLGNNRAQGGLYVFVRSGTTWSQQQRLTASDGQADDNFGQAVAIEGNNLVVGAFALNVRPGSGYIFERNGTNWTQQQKLAVNATHSDAFGQFVSLSGSTLLIGCPGDVRTPTLIGAAYVFTSSTVTSTPGTLQFSSTAYNVNENAGSAIVTVTRTGDVSAAASVSYTTADADTFTVGCGDTSQNQGGAFGRCDYATSIDTISFAPGETVKTFAIPIINDAIVENDETFTVTLKNIVGAAALGSPSTTTVTIHDDDVLGEPNPVLSTPFFVRQHYLDFLSREPEQGEPWSAVLSNCSDVNNNPICDRLTVSAAFFGSPEFQLKGYFVFRFYKLAFDRLPTYTEIVSDMRSITGQTPAELFQKKGAFTSSFLQRAEFMNTFDAMSNSQYVTALMSRYGFTQVTTPDPSQPDGTVKGTLTIPDMTNQLNASTLTRAQVLRAIADSDQTFNIEFNQAFVAMQYYGYLRRAPDVPGYDAWLSYLNAHPTESRIMVDGFLNSAEYRFRFGP